MKPERFDFLKSYLNRSQEAEPTRWGWKKMAQIAIRTWPFTKPMLIHLLVLLPLTFSGVIAATVGGILVGGDLLFNKVLEGQKLQPFQAWVLNVGDEYVTKDPAELGGIQFELKGSGKSKPSKDASPSNGKTDGVAKPELTQEQRKTVRNRLVIWGIVLGVPGAIFGIALWYYSTWIWQSINQNLREAMFQRAETLSLKFHNRARVGDAIFRIYQDSAQIVNLIREGIYSPLNMLFTLAMTLCVVAAFDPIFALFVVVIAVPLAWLAVVVTPRIRRSVLANRLANSDLVSRTQESFNAVKLVKANSAEATVLNSFHVDSNRALNAAYFLRLDMVLITFVVAAIGGLVLIGSELLMVKWIIEERATFLGALVATFIGFSVWNLGAFRIASGQVGASNAYARGFLGIWMRLQDLYIALERAFELLDADSDVEDPAEPLPVPDSIESVSWEDVHFRYDDEHPVLQGVDLAANRGTITAVVGPTGCGKSTMVSLLLRLFDPDQGRVLLNHTDLRDVEIDQLRQSVSIALQKNVLFATTVAGNISFGTSKLDRRTIIEAARVADAHEFIEDLPGGYDTELGERGGKLSAGQRQRISIARAVYRDTPILILDEPTASLDARTEKRVIDNLKEWGRDRVIFLVTHRLSTIRLADQIALLGEGSIAESGTHEELMAIPDSRYRRLVELEERSTGTATR